MTDKFILLQSFPTLRHSPVPCLMPLKFTDKITHRYNFVAKGLVKNWLQTPQPLDPFHRHPTNSSIACISRLTYQSFFVHRGHATMDSLVMSSVPYSTEPCII